MFYTIYYKRELKNFESERVAASEPVETSGAAARELVIEGRNIAVESRASWTLRSSYIICICRCPFENFGCCMMQVFK